MDTIREIIRQNQNSAPIDILELLAGYAIGRPKEFVLSHPEFRLNFLEYWRFKKKLRRLKQGWPVAYITGHKEFFGLDFLVNRHTLIPRPETELIVEEAGEFIASAKGRPTSGWNSSQPIVLIDVGTGSGCIPIAIAKHFKLSFPRKRESITDQNDLDSRFRGNDKNKNDILSIIATDISRGALKVAKRNAKIHAIKIKFLRGNLLEPIIKNYKSQISYYKNIIITANLPYLTAEQFANEPSIQREPRTALIAGNHGLASYEQLIKQIKILTSNIRNIHVAIYLEIDPSQSARISEIILNILPVATFQIKKDLAGLDRLVIISLN